jgi:hypothetical protein
VGFGKKNRKKILLKYKGNKGIKHAMERNEKGIKENEKEIKDHKKNKTKKLGV